MKFPDMRYYACFFILLLHSTPCLSQQKILLVGTYHTTPKDRLNEIIPIAAALERFHPGIICAEYPIPTDSVSVKCKASIMSGDGEHIFERLEALRNDWRIPIGDLAKIEALQHEGIHADMQKQIQLQQLYFLSSNAANADYRGYLIMSSLKTDAEETDALQELYPGFKTLQTTYEIKRARSDEYYLLVFPLAALLNISYIYPIDDFTTWKEFEKYDDRLHMADTTDASIKIFRKRQADFFKNLRSLPKDSNQWMFVNSPQAIDDLLYVEGSKLDAGISKEDIKMLHYYWVQRNKKMAQHIDAVAREHPNTGIAVFFGASHVGPVRDELKEMNKSYKVLTLMDVMK